MNLAQYFKENKGTGVLATANGSGDVNGAIYARPHFLDEGRPETLSFVMRDRLTHKYLETNPHAFYTFIEEGEGYKGTRLALTKTGEEADRKKIASIRRRNLPAICREGEEKENLYLVHFKVDSARPLVGSGEVDK